MFRAEDLVGMYEGLEDSLIEKEAWTDLGGGTAYADASDTEREYQSHWTASPCPVEDEGALRPWWKIPIPSKEEDAEDLMSLPASFITGMDDLDRGLNPPLPRGAGRKSRWAQKEEEELADDGLCRGREGAGDGLQWAGLPARVLHMVIAKLEDSTLEDQWPDCRDVVACASVCRRWRHIVLGAARRPKDSGLLTFPSSLKQPGPPDLPIQCFIRRRRTWAGKESYLLYLGLPPTSFEYGKLLMTAEKRWHLTWCDYVITLGGRRRIAASPTVLGVVRANLPMLSTRFSVHETDIIELPVSCAMPPCDSKKGTRGMFRLQRSKVAPQMRTGDPVMLVEHKLGTSQTKGPSRIMVTINGRNESQPRQGQHPQGRPPLEERLSEDSLRKIGRKSKAEVKTLVLKNRAPRWHENLQRWCLNFGPRVAIPSTKNFQLMAPGETGKPWDPEEVVLQFGRVDKDLFSMDFRHPLSAFQAFSICLTTFNLKL